MLLSHIPTHRAHDLHCKILFRPNWLYSMLQVLQLQSLQSYQNKAVPSAALLFVHIERAHSLPVSHLQFMHVLCSSFKKMILYMIKLECLCLPQQLKKSGKEPKAGAELVLGETSYKTKVRLLKHDVLYSDRYIIIIVITRILSCHHVSKAVWS